MRVCLYLSALPPRLSLSGFEPYEAVALYDFTPILSGDMGFKRSEVLLITGRYDGNPNRLMAEISERHGSVPHKYIAKVECTALALRDYDKSKCTAVRRCDYDIYAEVGTGEGEGAACSTCVRCVVPFAYNL